MNNNNNSQKRGSSFSSDEMPPISETQIPSFIIQNSSQDGISGDGDANSAAAQSSADKSKSVFGKFRKKTSKQQSSPVPPPSLHSNDPATTTAQQQQQKQHVRKDSNDEQRPDGLSRIPAIRGPRTDRMGRPGSVPPSAQNSISINEVTLDEDNSCHDSSNHTNNGEDALFRRTSTRSAEDYFESPSLAPSSTTTAAAATSIDAPPPTTLRASISHGSMMPRSSLSALLPTVHSSRQLTNTELSCSGDTGLARGGAERSGSNIAEDSFSSLDETFGMGMGYRRGGRGSTASNMSGISNSSLVSSTTSSAGIGGGYGSVGVKDKKGFGYVGFDLTDPTQLHAAMSSGLLTKNDTNATAAAASVLQDAPSRVHRRYNVGDKVLICNHQSRWSNLVNKYGFPDREGRTPEEQRGPYVYVLARVTKVHFEEDAQYYTVRRYDTGVEQRADAEWMEPIRSGPGEIAAMKAAQESNTLPSSQQNGKNVQTSKSGLSRFLSMFLTEGEPWYIQMLLCIVKPLALIFYFLNSTVGRCLRSCSVWIYSALRRQAILLLNGMSPYSCSLRCTGVNLLVICSTWYTLIDQFRLAFIPASADKAIAIVSCVAWFILVLELLFEVFIRPDGYKQLIISDKAYEPSTVRNINTFHLVVECISLGFFVPEIVCLFSTYECGDSPSFSLLNATIMSVVGPAQSNAFYGRAFFAVIRLRIFGLVRHWKQMWINNTYVNVKRKKNRFSFFIPTGRGRKVHVDHPIVRSATGTDMTTESERNIEHQSPTDIEVKKHASPYDQDNHLTNVTTIGTALMVVNSHRALMIIGAIVGLFPLLYTIRENGGANIVANTMVEQLQGTNLIANSSDAEYCEYLGDSVSTWMTGIERSSMGDDNTGTANVPFVLWLEILPVRCDFQGSDGVITQKFCDQFGDIDIFENTCFIWGTSDMDDSVEALTARAGIRQGVAIYRNSSRMSRLNNNGTVTTELYSTKAIFQENASVQPANRYSFILQLILVIFILFGLSVLRSDAARLVLGPLRRMLKIVSLYAKNPLSPAPTSQKGKRDTLGESEEDSAAYAVSDSDDDDQVSAENKLGNFETEQLISAITKITDLLRKCWGVAGAGIVSSNLARQKDGQTAVFNPCVPGKCVYALFAFCGINGFDHQLRALQGEIMNLINDVAAVLHKEVYRWGYGDSGQCNKNLGANFLMVFRIGDVKEVREKRDRARDVIFDPRSATKGRPKSTAYRRKFGVKTTGAVGGRGDVSEGSAVVRPKKKQVSSKPNPKDSLSLASLPGISAFTDRAVIGMLKTYAGIYRDQKLLDWKNDFRLGAGVGAFSVDMIFGMDAGWAVEGAVGSEYKIDATYLSPHVNMASRMMSACKQYGVSILLSQAVGELLSDMGKKKLRHLDTITVKGSSVKQRIYTYDARHKGVDFFLHERTEDQADIAAERYAPSIWETDQDLKAMRQHVTDDFVEKFNVGRAEYLAGNWPSAINYLKAADEIMVQNVIDQGWVDDEMNENDDPIADELEVTASYRGNEMGDGPSRRLISVMEQAGGIAPADWKGYRPLTSK